MLTKDQLKVAATFRCPYCGSGSVTNELTELYIGEAVFDFTCEECEKEWSVTFSLTAKEGC